ncbi:MAG: response regulator [Wenzhouxiangellaceae bacterium]
MTRVLIADDHPLFRNALRAALSQVVDAVEVLEAEDLRRTRETLEREPDIDLLLLDLHMPGSRGLAGLAALRAGYAAVAVVVVSASEDPAVIRRALDLGASGFIPKSSGLEVLAEALDRVLACETWVPPHLHAALPAGDCEDRELARRIASLTPRQLRVLELVADGQLNKQIADRLAIQERTVKAHISEIFTRLGVRNRTQAGIAFRRLELIDPAARVELDASAGPESTQ